MSGGGFCDREVINVGDHKALGYRHVKGDDVVKEEKGGDGGPLGGADGNWGGKIGGPLEHQGTGPFR